MRVRTIVDEALGNTSYLVTVGEGLAVSVDPRRDVDEHLARAREDGVRIVAVFETHLHADFISGAREIARATGADVYAAAAAGLATPHRGVADGDVVRVGDATIEVIATPGHTPEHVAYLFRDDEGAAVFSGGALIVGGAARTDLAGADRTEALTRAQYDSVRRLATLPAETALHPTHGGGSFCSTGPARTEASTIGVERATNPLLAAPDPDAFADTLRAGLGSYPRYFDHLADVNRAGAPLLETFPPLQELAAAEALARARDDAWLVDARPAAEWARAHPDGSISIALRSSFASWLGWVVPFGEPVVLVLEPDGVGEAERLARRIGYDALEGWLTFGSWRDAGLPVASVPEVEPRAAAEGSATLLDVRQRHEYASRHLPGSVHIELGDIIAGASPPPGEVITYCRSGERSATAASILARRGVPVANLRGGADAWRAAGLTLER